MNVQERYEKFRADMYMRVVDGLVPEIESAIEQTVNAHLAAKDALSQLARVRNELSRLGALTNNRDESALNRLREEITMDDSIRRYEAESFVYFVEAGDYIKIGFSRDPMTRLSQIRNGRGITAPEGLDTSKTRILAVEHGGMYDEKDLHRRFAAQRAEGEWFRKHESLTYYIKSITTPTETK